MFEKDHMLPADFNQHRAKGNILHLLLSTRVINLLGLAMPLMLLQAYDRILPHYGMGTLTLLVSGVVQTHPHISIESAFGER